MSNPPDYIKQWRYKGCFKDKEAKPKFCNIFGGNCDPAVYRAIPTKLGGSYNINTCLDTASAKGYNVAGLQFKNECWVGKNSNYSQYGNQNATSNCNINNVGSYTNMVYTKTNTYKDTGYNCNYGNNKIPVIVDSNSIITVPLNYKIFDSNNACNDWINNTLYDGNYLSCSESNGDNICGKLYKDLDIKTYSDNGFKIDTNINGEQILGKYDKNSYTCASFDGENCLKDLNIYKPLEKPLKNVVCETYQTSTKSPANFCQKAFDYYNLYPSTNPLVIRARNINQAIPNTINNDVTLNNLASTYRNNFTNINTVEGIKNGINTLMENAPIKIACCGRTNPNNNTALPLNTRVPLSPNIASQNPLLKSFNFQQENITIPPNSCPTNLTQNSPDCNAFFGVYCENVINTFNEQKLPQTEFIKYAPECACYVPKTPEQQYYPAGAPSICYKDGCTQNSISYLDPTSQGPNAKCDMTICQNIVNTAGLTAGGNANITPTLQNNCGQYIPPESSTPQSGSSTSQSGSSTSQSGSSTSQSGSSTTQSSSSIPQSSSSITQSGSSTPQSDSSTTQLDSSTTQSSSSYIYIIIIIIIIILLLCSVSVYFIRKKK
jgi:hypothetical protein